MDIFVHEHDMVNLSLVGVIIAELSFAQMSFQSISQPTKRPELTQEQASVGIGSPD